MNTIPALNPDLDLDALRIDFDTKRNTIRYAYEVGTIEALELWKGLAAINELEREAGLLPN